MGESVSAASGTASAFVKARGNRLAPEGVDPDGDRSDFALEISVGRASSAPPGRVGARARPARRVRPPAA